METEKKELAIDPIMELAICQQTLGTIPFSIAQENIIGKPLRDVVVRLEHVKQALINAIQQPEKSIAQKKAAKKVTPPPKPEE